MPAQLDQLWDDIRGELRRETPDFKFHIWLEPLELAAVRGRTLYIRAPSHIRTSVSERYLPLLRRAAAACFDGRAVVEVVDSAWHPAEDEGTDGARQTAPAIHAGLNPKYTFEQFVIGAGNRFAHAAALAVAELPSQAYNPLFLHGPPGVGKTHLLHAIGDYIGRFGVGMQVRYATIEEFTSEFVEALRDRRTAGFKQSFRRADVVLIDDMQFLAGRTKTREEFFHTFNVLLDAGRQLVMTSDRGPQELPDVETRLTERFRSGLVVELDAPDVAVRRAILAARVQLDGVDIPKDVLDEIAMRVTSSVRALEGALIRVVAYASLKGEAPTPELARHVLGSSRGRSSSKDHRREDRRGDGRRVPDRYGGASRARPKAGRGNGPAGRDVPLPRAHLAQPSRDRQANRRPEPHNGAPCGEPHPDHHPNRPRCRRSGRQPPEAARGAG